MAHFAEIDKNNIVIRVLTACTKEVDSHGGDKSEEAALDFGNKVPFSPGGVKWIQTSYNNNFRKKFAGVGDYYDSIKDVFIASKPFNSWILDSNNDWKAPIAFPTIVENINKIIGKDLNDPTKDVYGHYDISWDENNLRWVGKDENNQPLKWNTSTLSWENQ